MNREEAAEGDTEIVRGSSIYNLAIQCINLFESLQASSLTNSIGDDMEDHDDTAAALLEPLAKTFRLWINYTGAWAPAGRSFDDLLSDYEDIKGMTVDLLEMMRRNLEYREWHHFKPTHSTDLPHVVCYTPPISPESAGSSDSGSSDTNIQDEAMSCIDHSIEYLLVIAAAIRRSSVQNQKYDLISQFHSEEDLLFKKWATIYTKREWPFARRSLCEHMGTALAVRRKRLLWSAKRNVSYKPKEPVTHTVIDSAPMVEAANSVAGPSISALPRLPIRIQEVAEMAEKRKRADDLLTQFDVNKARRLIKGRQTLSMRSTGSSVKHSIVAYPPVPVFTAGDRHCPCPYCARPLESTKLRNIRYWEYVSLLHAA
jgi:hypothetical protein